MNCQEFRSKWEHSTDEAVLAHIESCDDCLDWIEKTGSTSEEAMFLKEYPIPSVELEDRIMQAIYQTAEKGFPLTATAMPAGCEPLSIHPRKRRFFIPAWAAAAGILLAVGMIGGPLIMNQQTEQFAENAAVAPSASPSGLSESLELAPADQPSVSAETSASEASPPAGAQVPSKAESKTTPDASVSASQTADNVAAADRATASKPEASAAVPSTHAQMNELAAVQGPSHPMSPITARSRTDGSQAPAASNKTRAQSAPVEQPVTEPAAEPQIAALLPGAESLQANEAPAADAVGNKEPKAKGTPHNVEEAEQGIAMSIAGGETELADSIGNSPMNTALTANNPLTVSTFNDLDTAVQASDLPVPAFSKAPAHYALDSLTVHYESQTSKHVTYLQTAYQEAQGSKRITVDVKPQQGKRSLSVPGEFTQTHVFQIDGEQAIGVTFTDGADAESFKSAVHYQINKPDQSLYVVVTADSMPLPELMELCKQIVWK